MMIVSSAQNVKPCRRLASPHPKKAARILINFMKSITQAKHAEKCKGRVFSVVTRNYVAARLMMPNDPVLIPVAGSRDAEREIFCDDCTAEIDDLDI